MANIMFCDGTNHYGSAASIPDKWDIVTTPNYLTWKNTVPAAPYDDKYYISMSGTGHGLAYSYYIQKTLTPALFVNATDRSAGYAASIAVGFRCYVSGIPAAETVLLTVWLDSVKKIELRYTSEGRLKFYLGETLIQTGDAGVFQFNVWQHIEVDCYTSAGTVFNVLINGVSALGGTYGGSFVLTGINAVRIHHPAQNATMNITDIVIGITNIGAAAIKQYIPNAAGTYSQFTPSAGANYECVDDASLNLTDYVSGVGTVDTYNFTDISPGTWAYFGVQIVAHVKKTNKGDCSAALVTYLNSTVYPTAEQLSGDYSYRIHDLTDSEKFLTVFLAENPDTGGDFIHTAINSAEFGIKNVS